jgi:hypothetical protein
MVEVSGFQLKKYCHFFNIKKICETTDIHN